MANGWKGLRVVDVSTPSAQLEVAAHEPVAAARAVAVAGGHAYVADQDAGMTVLTACSLFVDGFEAGDTAAWSSSTH